jgi:carbamoyl-phosphate synthase large subunit
LPVREVERELKPTTMVTGAGGPAGVAVIRALRAAGIPVVAVDADRMAAGLRLAERAALVPPADHPGFPEELARAAERTAARALISTVAEELLVLIPQEQRLANAGLATWFPSPGSVLACVDKWRFAQIMSGSGAAIPAASYGHPNGVPGPWIVKPRFGRGSRSVYEVDVREDLQWPLRRVENPIVQTRLTGREFTVDALVDRNGELAGAVPRWRLETKGGISTKGETFADERVTSGVAQVLKTLGLVGPANVQGFVSERGEVSFVEVNPRFSGGLPLSLAAGADLVGQYLRGILGQPLERERLTFRPGVTMTRHFEEIFDGVEPA